MSFKDTVAGLDIPTVDDELTMPPRLYWHNGDRRAKTPGSFYTNADEYTDPPIKPWALVDRFQGEQGYTTTLLKIAIIGIRMQPFITDPQSKQRIYIDAYRPGALIQTDVLCFADGITDPVVWRTKGLTGKAVTDRARGIVAQYRATLLRAASAEAGKVMPLWTFWLPITGESERGVPIYRDTGHGSYVTPPILHPQATETTPKVMDRLFVGAELLAFGADVRRQYDGWLKERLSGHAGGSDPESEELDAG